MIAPTSISASACNAMAAAGPGAAATAPRKLRVLMIHSFRTSAAIFKEQMKRSGLDVQLADALEMIYVDAPFEATGPIPKDVEPFFKGPYREWWNFKQDAEGHMIYEGYAESIAFLEAQLRWHAPVDGLVGFSQGSALSSLLVSYQRQGVLLKSVDPLKFCVLIAGTPSRLDAHRSAYEQPIDCPSLHLIGERDFLKPYSEMLAECFQDAEVVRHPRGHVVPQLPPEDVQLIRTFLRRIAERAGSSGGGGGGGGGGCGGGFVSSL